ncbi:Tat pathway signal sequence domain protein [Actinoplanes sp. GCM10030250]|uniref:Tat pathway signal sequence domain protein n=1 Tax=Actinoplanes sp. GCM10030250 TaxID=3273376 RepID=UPI00360E126A
MRKHRLLAATTGALLTTLLTATPALAADNTVLTSGSVAGAAVAAGATISSSLAAGTTAVFATAPGATSGMTCTTSSISALIADNPAAPGSATAGSTLALSDCTVSGIFGVLGVNSVTINNQPFATAVNSDGSVSVTGTEAAAIQATLVLRTLLGTVTCVFTANGNAITGTADNTDNSISFADQRFDRTSGPSACVTAGYFTARYAPVADDAGSPVFVN